jgi:hypothetical protein
MYSLPLSNQTTELRLRMPTRFVLSTKPTSNADRYRFKLMMDNFLETPGSNMAVVVDGQSGRGRAHTMFTDSSDNISAWVLRELFKLSRCPDDYIPLHMYGSMLRDTRSC